MQFQNQIVGQPYALPLYSANHQRANSSISAALHFHLHFNTQPPLAVHHFLSTIPLPNPDHYNISSPPRDHRPEKERESRISHPREKKRKPRAAIFSVSVRKPEERKGETVHAFHLHLHLHQLQPPQPGPTIACVSQPRGEEGNFSFCRMSELPVEVISGLKAVDYR